MAVFFLEKNLLVAQVKANWNQENQISFALD
jgi:hypothetical protein